MPLNVLVTAGSRRVPLVQAFQRSLSRVSPGGAVVVTDVNELSPTVYTAERAYPVPLSTDPSYLDAIEGVCKIEDIGLVVPTIDDELPIFARATDRFAALGIRVAVSPERTTEICDDKFETCRVLQEAGVAAADTYLPGALPDQLEYPLFIKPRVGRGGIGAFPLRNPRELEFFLDYVANPIVQTFLDGPEYTIDVLCDFNGRPLAVVPRERVVVRAGVVDRGRTVADPALIELGLQCTNVLAFAGPVNIQCRVVDGRPVVFEINARFSGGIPLTIAAGADFPRMLAELTLGRPVTPSVGRFEEQLWMTNYDTSLFLPGRTVGFRSIGRRTRPREVA